MKCLSSGIRPVIVLAWSLTVTCLTPARVSASEDEVNAVLAAWKKKADAVTSLRYRAEGEAFCPKGRFNDSPGRLPGAKGDLPAEDHTYPVSALWLLQLEKNWVRKEVASERFYESVERFAPTFQVQLFDDSETQVYEPRDQNTSARYTPGKYQPDLLLQTKQFSNVFLGYQEMAIFLAHGIVATGDWIPTPKQLKRPPPPGTFHTQGKVILGGREHLVLRTDARTRNAIVDEYCVDCARGSVIARWSRYVQGVLRRRTDIRYKEGRGGWELEGWKVTIHEGGKVDLSESLRVVEREVNPVLHQEDFSIKPAAGMVVLNVPADRQYLLDSEGREHLIVDGHLLSEPPSRRIWVWVAGFLLLSSLAIAVIVFRKTRKAA
jgi:hypothetical protein